MNMSEAKNGTAVSVTEKPFSGSNRHPTKYAAARYPDADAKPQKQQSLGLSRKTDKRISGKYTSTQGVANGR